MERQLNLVFKRDNRRNATKLLTFVYGTKTIINLKKLGIENKLFENRDGWYDCDGELISDELDIFEKDDRQINLGDVIYSWVTPTRLTFEEFEAYIDDVDSDIFEILEERGANKDVISYLLKKYIYSELNFLNFIKKISENLYYGCTLNEILEIIGEEEEED